MLPEREFEDGKGGKEGKGTEPSIMLFADLERGRGERKEGQEQRAGLFIRWR